MSTRSYKYSVTEALALPLILDASILIHDFSDIMTPVLTIPTSFLEADRINYASIFR
jgi:hypothetical protein